MEEDGQILIIAVTIPVLIALVFPLVGASLLTFGVLCAVGSIIGG